MNASRLSFLLIATSFSLLITGCTATKVTRAKALSGFEQVSREEAFAIVKKEASAAHFMQGTRRIGHPYVADVNELGFILERATAWQGLVNYAISGDKPPYYQDGGAAFSDVYKITTMDGGWINIYAHHRGGKFMMACTSEDSAHINRLLAALVVLCPNVQ